MTLTAPPRPPRLGPRERTDPRVTLTKLAEVVDPHCGIVTGLGRFHFHDRALRELHGYAALLETASILGSRFLTSKRGEGGPEAWRHIAEGRNGHRVAFDAERALVRAVGEALERYACGTYDPSRFDTAAWSEVAEQALDPRTVQMPTAAEYELLKGFAPFEPEAPMRWTWGWSVRDRRAVRVPAQLCYLSYNPLPGEPMMQTTTSTGWAIHHTREEALQSALREVVERDAFFIHWLNKLTPPRLDLASVDVPEAHRLAAEVEARGTELVVLDTTTDLGVPSFAVLAVDERPGHPAFALTLGAHVDKARGLLQAIEEAAMIIVHLRERAASGEVAPPARMEDINAMSEHADFYLDQRNLHHLAWLWTGNETVQWDDIPDLAATDGDVWGEVTTLVDAWAKVGCDVLYVDTTPPDLARAGWTTAKVLVPGSVRHEYGYGLRLLDCPRIYEAPVRMGRRDAALSPEGVNPDAHPYA